MKSYEIPKEYEIKAVSHIKEIDAHAVEIYHAKSGASLFYLDREDENMTFAIGFKTPPYDDTGVFHILEHCVLCGSDKFPVKDPMTQLMSGSLYTYLNAFTYPDKTVYPVSSKNNKSFLNLIDVYMDAVFNPLLLKNKSIFMSEGHRIEYTDSGEPTVNGVVYNEMTGAYSSPEELTEHFISKLLYHGGCYSYDSGGYPDVIPSLTYEDFLDAHKRFYRPDNSYIFLDGSIELYKTLTLINVYLEKYQKTEYQPEITIGRTVTDICRESYPIADSEDASDKARIAISYRAYPHKANIENLAMTAIVDSISDSNSSPLKRRILDSGMCENLYVYYSCQSALSTLSVQFINVKDGKEEELISLWDEVISDIAHRDISADRLESVLNMLEFKTREADFGSFPKGMVYMSAFMEYAMFGESPVCAFQYDKLFAALREKLDTDYFSNLMLNVLKSDRATLILYPDKELEKKRSEITNSMLLNKINSMTEKENQNYNKELSDCLSWQESQDSQDALLSIPRLSLSDIGDPPSEAPTDICDINGVTVITHTMETSGIIYAELLFDVSDIDEEKLSALRLFTLTLPELDTARGTSQSFRNRVKKHLGDLSVSLSALKGADGAKIYLTVKASCLIGKIDRLTELVYEYLYTSVLDNTEKISERISQIYTASHESLVSDAMSCVITRVNARYDDISAINDKLYGYQFHTELKKATRGGIKAVRTLTKFFNDLRERYLNQARLTIDVTSTSTDGISEKLIKVIREGGEPAGHASVRRSAKENEGIEIPGSVAYSAYGSNLLEETEHEYCGSFAVLSSILGYEYLWGEIRIKGGAYDTGLITKGASGGVTCYSYRDPSPERSVNIFKSIPSSIKIILDENNDITKYIISTLGAMDPVSTPRSRAASAMTLYLTGKGNDYMKKMREDILKTDKDELIRLSCILEELASSSTWCIAAPGNILNRAEADKILEI